MNIQGLDVLDNKILDVIKDNARATFSEIGKSVGLSRVAVKNRIEAMERKGIIEGYKTVINSTKAVNGVEFVMDIETVPEKYGEVVATLQSDKLLRKVYTTSGDCRLHAVGFAPNANTLASHVNYHYLNTKGIRRISWHILLNIIREKVGGVDYENTGK